MTYHSFVTQMGLGQLGGDEESRTPDLLLARQALSQLSYTPMFFILGVLRALPDNCQSLLCSNFAVEVHPQSKINN